MGADGRTTSGLFDDYEEKLAEKDAEIARLREMLHTLYENKLEPDKLYNQIPRYHKEMKEMERRGGRR